MKNLYLNAGIESERTRARAMQAAGAAFREWLRLKADADADPVAVSEAREAYARASRAEVAPRA